MECCKEWEAQTIAQQPALEAEGDESRLQFNQDPVVAVVGETI